MKRFASAVLVLVLLALSVPVMGLTDLGHPAITRLWAGDQFNCTGWYLVPMTVEKSFSMWEGWLPDWSDDQRGMAWIVSAGHCRGTASVRRDLTAYIIGIVKWVGIIESKPNTVHRFADLAVGAVPDPRRDGRAYLRLADRDAAPGEQVLIHGFPRGVERIVHGEVTSLKKPMLADTILLKIPSGEWSVWGGASGSPVLNMNGEVVGVLWGVAFDEDPTRPPSPYGNHVVPTPDNLRWATMTPVSRLKELLKVMGVHGYE